MKKLKADTTKHHLVSPSCTLEDKFTQVSKCPKDSNNVGKFSVKTPLQLDHVGQLGVSEAMKEFTVKAKIDLSKQPFHKIAMQLVEFTQTITNCIEDTGMMEWVLFQDNMIRVPATTTIFFFNRG